MKKLLSIVLALSMVMSLGCVVLADDSLPDFGKLWGDTAEPGVPAAEAFVEIKADVAQDGYAAGETVDVVLTVAGVSLGKIMISNGKVSVEADDGVSTLSFELHYNKELVTPVPLAEIADDSEEGNATALMTANPGWEGMGKIDSENGFIDFAFGDTSAKAYQDIKIVNSKNLAALEITVSFVVNEGVSGEDIVFSFENAVASNLDLSLNCAPAIEAAKVVDAANLPQLPEKVELPANAFAITHAGYVYEAGVTFIYYAAEDTTLSDMVYAAIGEHASQDFNYYAAIICDANGVVTALNTTIGRPDGVKGDTAIPAGHFLIGVNGHSSQFAAVKDIVKVGSEITLYNVNLPGTNVVSNPVAMDKAGFTVYTEMPVQPESLGNLPSDAIGITHAGYIHEADKVVIMATDIDTTIGAIVTRGEPVRYAPGSTKVPDMNYWGIIIVDSGNTIIYKNTTLGSEGIKTDVPVPAGAYVIGAHSSNASINSAELGQKVELFNILLDGVKNNRGHQALTNAGYRIYDAAPIQPDDLATVPSTATKLTNAGYIHAAGAAVIMATDVDTTVGALVLKGDGATVGDEAPDMNYWGIIIADKDGIITLVNNTLGRPDGVKTDIAVPAGSFVIGIHGGSTVIASAEVGQKVELYNILVDGVAQLSGNKAITGAAFEIVASGLSVKDGANAVYDEENNTVTVYENGIDVKAFKAMLESDVEILDKDGNEVKSGTVKTGMTANGTLIVILGDVNCNGRVDAGDYALIKRTVLRTNVMDDTEKAAGDANVNGRIDAGDYTMIKRVVLKSYEFSELLKK